MIQFTSISSQIINIYICTLNMTYDDLIFIHKQIDINIDMIISSQSPSTPTQPNATNMSTIKRLLRLAQDYLRAHPSPTSTQLFPSLLKLNYTYSCPSTNSKSKKQILYQLPPSPISQSTPLKSSQSHQNQISISSCQPSLAFDQKSNRLEYVNNYDTILTEEAHDKVLQDAIFGTAKLSKDGNRWIYTAKKKVPKGRGYFNGGAGKSVYIHDLGELYDDVGQVGVFLWDMKLAKIIPIDIKIQGEPQHTKYSFSSPIFTDDQGSSFICHAYKATQFGYGVSHCFNRPIQIFQVQLKNIGSQSQNQSQKFKVISKKLVTKHETNMFANVSPCYQYVSYFGGSDFVHAYYLDLVVIKREKEGQIKEGQSKIQQGKQENNGNIVDGYDRQWKQIHRIKDAFIGSYLTLKTQSFTHQNTPYLYFQTTQQAKQVLKLLNFVTGQISQISQNKTGESYSMLSFCEQQSLLTGVMTSHQFSTFFHLLSHPNVKPTLIPPLKIEQQFTIEQISQPIHAYYLSTSTQNQQTSSNTKKPLLILIHGGPHGYGDPCLTLFKYLLLKSGYSILIPNFSGSVGFGRDYLKAAIGQLGQKDGKQIIALLEHVLKIKGQEIDKQKVHVYGGSYGGYMAAIMGSRFPQYFRSAVILNGVLSIPGNFWFSDIPEWSTAQALGQAKIHNLTGQDYVKMFEQSPMSQPMKIPTLQFLGAKDRRVPYRQGLLFDAITKKHGTKIKTYVYENAAHSLADSVDTSIDVVLKSMLFLEGKDLENVEKQIKEAKEKENKEKQAKKLNKTETKKQASLSQQQKKQEKKFVTEAEKVAGETVSQQNQPEK